MRTKSNRPLLPGLLLTLTLLATAAKAQYAYDMIRLGSLGGYTVPEGINSKG